MIIMKRKKHSRKKCKDCIHFDGCYCLILYRRHDPMTTRCKKDYSPKEPFYTKGSFWLLTFMFLAIAVTVFVLTR
jgi:hypothetical protein